jgi:hypothetical protein
VAVLGTVRNAKIPGSRLVEAKSAGWIYRLSENRGLLWHSTASFSEKGLQISKKGDFRNIPIMKRACFPEETSSTVLTKRVNEIKGAWKAFISILDFRGLQPFFLLFLGVRSRQGKVCSKRPFSSADEQPVNLASLAAAALPSSGKFSTSG